MSSKEFKRFIFDTRWMKSGGIGRFCFEMMKSDSVNCFELLHGTLSQALSFKDLFLLSKITLSRDYFISPGYNCPVISMGRAIVTLHDLMHLHYPEYSGIKNKIYYDFIVKRTIRTAPIVFTVSEFTRQEISKWANITLEKIAVIPNGVDHDFYHSNVNPIVRVRPYFFYVGNNKPHKNLTRLIEAFSLSSFNGEVDLLISCTPTDELNVLINKLGLSNKVVFLAGVDEHDLPSYYKGALATVVVSLYEGFCLPILESMAVGTPVITSNITAMPETAGGAAVLVDPYSVDSIQNALEYLFHNESDRAKLIELGLERSQHFSWDRSRELWDNALNSIEGSL